MPAVQKFNFKKLLDESVKIHGHLCPGQVLAVRMSIFGLNKIGIKDPKGKDRKNLIVFVEIDRCVTDTIQSVTPRYIIQLNQRLFPETSKSCQFSP